MLIKGLQKLTLIDYPGKIATTIFIFGCNFRCPYCHNPELLNASEAKKFRAYSKEEILRFLKERCDFLEGVCITGGEPTLSKDLPTLIKSIKKIGYVIKLDTNGTNPKMLRELIKAKLIDYIAMDIKAPLEKYEKIVNAPVNKNDIEESINIIKKLGDYEFRTTIVPGLLSKQDIIEIAKWIKPAKAYYLQQFRPVNCLNKSYNKRKPYSLEQLRQMQEAVKRFFQICEIREVTY